MSSTDAVRQLVDKVTSTDLKGQDAAGTQQLVKAINQKQELAKTCADQIQKRMGTGQPKVIFLALCLLDFCVDKTNISFHREIGTKEFMHILIAMLNNKQLPKEVQQKIVYLIQKWGTKFEKQRDLLPLFSDVYTALKNSGVQFPPQQPQASASASAAPAKKADKPAPKKAAGAAPVSLDASKVPQKYKKLLGDMNLVKGNINFTNEMLDGMTPGPAAKKNETVNDLVKTLTDMEPKLFTLIGKVENEDVMNVCLIVNDDLQKTFKRWHDLQEGTKPEPFVPGESLKPTVLAPTHIYAAASDSPAQEDEYYDEEEEEAQPAKKQEEPRHAQPGQGGATRSAEPMPDLLDLMGSSQPAAAQQPPPQRAPPMQAQPGAMNPTEMFNFDFGTAPAQQQPQQQQQQPPQAPPQKPIDPNDPLAQLNNIMSKMSVQPQQSQPQQPFGTYQQAQPNNMMNMVGANLNNQFNMANQQFQTGFGGMPGGMSNGTGMGGGMPNSMAGGNPFGASTGSAPMANGGNPFDAGFGEKRPGPTAESWNKDLGDLGRQVNEPKQKQAEGPTVQEFKDLFSMADMKIKHTAGMKQRTEHTYNPIGFAQEQPSLNSTVASAVQEEKSVPKQQAQPADDPFGFGKDQAQNMSAPAQAQPVAAAEPKSDMFDFGADPVPAATNPDLSSFSEPSIITANNESTDQAAAGGKPSGPDVFDLFGNQ